MKKTWQNFLFFKLILFSLLITSKKVIAKINCANQSSSINVTGINSSLALDTVLTGFNGTLNVKDVSASTITGSTFNFTGGVLTTGLVTASISGTIDPSSSDRITLSDTNYLSVSTGQVLQPITVATASTATITGQPKFTSSIILTDATSILSLGITTPLNQSVTGLGKVSLLDDLTLAAGVQMPSIVNQNGYRLTYTSGTINVATTNTTGGLIEFSGYTQLTQQLTIGTGADVYHMNGNGNVLDLSGSGAIVFNGGTLYLADIHIRGLSNANALKGSGLIKMSNVTLELSADMTRTDGSFTFHGNNSTIITSTSKFTVSGSNALNVDGIVLYWNQLDGTDNSPFSNIAGGIIQYQNNGQIQNGLSVAASLGISGTSYTFSKDFLLSTATSLTVQNATPGSSKTVTISGGGHYLHFPKTSGSFLNLNSNVQLVLNNIVLKDYYPEATAYSNAANSSVTFNNSVSVQMGSDLTINSGDKAWNFTGSGCEIDGYGYTLIVNKANGITVTGGNTLTLKNMTLVVSTVNSLAALTSTDRIKLQNVTVVLNNSNFVFSTGYLDIANFVKITGGLTASTNRVNFEFASAGQFTILGGSELFVDSNINLKYNADPVNDLTTYDSKRHMLFSSITSQLTLSGCSLECTATGIALNDGTMKVIDNVTINSTTSTGSEAEIGSNLFLNLSAGAVLDIAGPLKYVL